VSDFFAESLLQEIYLKIPEATENQCRQLCYSLTSVERNTDSSMKILKQSRSSEFNEFQRELFELNLQEIRALLVGKTPCIGVWWHQHFFGSQLTPVARRLVIEPGYLYLGLISAGCLEGGVTRSGQKDFCFGRYLLIPEDSDLEVCGFLNAVFFGESLHRETHVPRHVIRIGQPHGLDIPLDHVIVKYGGGWIFDYVLCAMKEEKKSEDHYFNVFPQPLIEHDSTHVCAIPSGYQKLDVFFQASKDIQVRKKIIFHISLWEVEVEAARKQLGATLGILLEAFPDREVLFRPDPVDIQHPELVSQLSPWIDHSRFEFSKTSSYIDDYADAEVLVTHRTSTAHTFSFATGRPIVVYQPDLSGKGDKGVQQTDTGYLVFNEQQLIDKLGQVLVNPRAETERIQAYMNKAIHCPGRAVDYIIDNLDTILRRECLDEWESFRLFDPTVQSEPDVQVLSSLEDSTKWGALSTNLAEAIIEKFPHNPTYRLKAADFYCRFSDPFEYTYYFRGWYQAVSHVSRAIDLCSENEQELKNEIHAWVVQKGMHMAHCVKWYICRQEMAEFGDDIDSIICKFCEEDGDAESFRKYPQYMEVIWRLKKPIAKVKKIMKYLGYSGE